MNKYSLILGLFFLQGCSQQPYFGKLEYLGKFPSNLSEVSGIDRDSNGNLWAIEDNGNKDILYQITPEGKAVKKLRIENAKNGDWEDLSISTTGTVYIGDFGNNANDRKDLRVYRIPKQELKKKSPKAETGSTLSNPWLLQSPADKRRLFFSLLASNTNVAAMQLLGCVHRDSGIEGGYFRVLKGTKKPAELDRS